MTEELVKRLEIVSRSERLTAGEADTVRLAIKALRCSAKSEPERCLTCGRSDAEYNACNWSCVDPWHADYHLRAKTLARQTTTSGLPLREGQAKECDGGLHTEPQTALPVLKPAAGELTVECPLCHQHVSETRCGAGNYQDCYCYITRSQAVSAPEPTREAIAKAIGTAMYGESTFRSPNLDGWNLSDVLPAADAVLALTRPERKA